MNIARFVLPAAALCVLQCFTPSLWSQEVTLRRVINVSYSSPAARQLSTNRGRLLWRETDPNTSNENLKYFSGAEIFLLDSNLTGGSSALDGDYAIWSTASGEVKIFNTRTWDTAWIGPSYNPDGTQPVAIADAKIVFARANGGTGSGIILHDAATGAETTLAEGIWNTEPSIHHGQVAWTSGPSLSIFSPSDICLYDGDHTRIISGPTGARNYSPLIRDGQVIWRRDSTGTSAVKLYTRDTIVTLAEINTPSDIIVGYDASDGVGIAARCDTSLGLSTIVIYDEGTRALTSVVDSTVVASPHIDNGVVVWQSGTGPNSTVKYLALPSMALSSMAAGERPVVDDDVVAWTLGDAVELDASLTFEQLTTDSRNGWEQSRFKPIDQGNIAYGNYASSLHTRLYYNDGSTATQVADSSLPNDFVMANDGVMIWRENADTLWMYDGTGARVKLLDSLQVENMYVANGFISFNGFRLNGGNNILQAWLYDIGGRTLQQLTSEDTIAVKTNIVHCDGRSAVWNRDSANHFMLMYYDGSSTRKLSLHDSVSFNFSYRGGVVAWSEVVNGVEQVMIYDTATHVTTQITQGNAPSTNAVTDGAHVVWYGDFSTTPTMYYYDIATGRTTKIAHTTNPRFRWDWLSNGKIAFTLNGDVFLFDGSSISQLTTSGQFPPNKEAYVDDDYVVWNRTDPSSFVVQGNIFRGKLHAHPSFSAKNIYGLVPLTVSFSNATWQGSQKYHWSFGDGGVSSLMNPEHTYSAPGRYSVTLTVTDPTGTRSEKKTLLVNAVTSTGVGPGNEPQPRTFALYQNYPNPFNPATMISFEIRDAGFVSLKVFDLLGREVATIVSERLAPGRYTRGWDARNLPSGVYTYRLTSGGTSLGRRMVLLR